jgi:truncated hemoglobin YjbI
MGSAHSYTTKQNLSRLSTANSGSTATTYTNKLNSSRLSAAASDSKATTYTNRVNSSRLGGINADAFVRNASLLSRLGGEEALNTLLRIFYGKALHDPRISRLFDTPDAVTQENRIVSQLAFMKAVLGGVNDGSVDVEQGYAHAATMGMTDEKYAAFVEAVTATLRGQNVPPTVIGEVEEFCATVRKHIVI